ncbi:MAG: epoxyqueuosine reductase [Desulfarculus sp.]|nr:MAG: epoxyqueuosine reductase [Desulfarculus sp.]
MGLKQLIREKALELGFEGIGFTGVEPLDLYIKEFRSRPEMYQWVTTPQFDLLRGAEVTQRYPWARSLLVLIRNYHRRRFPRQLIGVIGRCYQVDERKEKGSEHQRLMDFFAFLKDQGLKFRWDGEIPARMAAARAGVVTYGKNCFVYARGAMRGASWLESIPLVLDAELAPDEPSIELGCPDWCKNACVAACPTGALYAPKKMRPQRCIAYNTYFAPGLTPAELREPMGTWVYGCDRCQEVCPRNQPWLNQPLPDNPPLMARAEDFALERLLAMDTEYYLANIWPLCFYISRRQVAQWQMNAARALGNRGDREAAPLLARALADSPDYTVRAMAAWALGRLGGERAGKFLEAARPREDGMVRQEIEDALARARA